MKNIFSILLLLIFVLSAGQAQNGDKWEAWAESLAAKAEKIALKVSRDVERNAVEVAAVAESLAYDLEEKFDSGDFDIRIRGMQDDIYSSSSQNMGFLGIHSDHISRRKADKLGFKNFYGSYISKVVKNSAAENAGLQPFDYIFGVEDQRTSNNQTLSDILADYEPGNEVTLHFMRKEVSKTTKVILGGYDDFDWEVGLGEEAFLGVRPAAGERRHDMDGVTVEIVKGTTADEMGLESNDVIKAINDYPVLDWDDVSTAISNLKPGEDVSVLVKRGDREVEKKGLIKALENEGYAIISGGEENAWTWDTEEEEKEEWDEPGRAFLGVYIEEISEKKARALGFDNPHGSYVSGVIKGTAAEKAGLMPFDYIYGIDEYRVGEDQSLGGILRKFEAGDEAAVHYYRKGEKMKSQIVFRVRTETKKEVRNKCKDPFLGIIELDRERDQKGIRIRPVGNSTAKELGLEEGDVITHINGYQMYDWTDIGIAIDMLSPGDKIRINYVRDGSKRSGSQKILSYAETKKCKNCDCGEKDLVIKSPDIQIKFPDRYFGKASRKDISTLNVDMENMTEDEVSSMKSKGVEMEISDNLRIENLKLGPNPNIGMFELQFGLETEGETTINVFNPSARAIYTYDLGRFSGNFSDYIDISQNGPGTYYLRITQNGKSFVRKIVLTKG